MATQTRHFPTSPSHLALFRTIAAQLSGRQRDALAELAAGRPLTVAASAAGVHRSTLHHWLTHDPDFQSAHAALARHRAASASGLAALARSALEALLTDPALAPELRLRAIQLALTAVHTLPAPALLESLEEAPMSEATSVAQATAALALDADDFPSPADDFPCFLAADDPPSSIAPGPSPDPFSVPDGPHLPPPTDPAERAAFLASVRADLRRVALHLRGPGANQDPQTPAAAPPLVGHPLVGQPFQAAIRLSSQLDADPTPDTPPAPALVGSSPAWAPKPAATPVALATVARNAPCPCGSKLKFKRCCGSSAPPFLFPAASGHKTATEP